MVVIEGRDRIALGIQNVNPTAFAYRSLPKQNEPVRDTRELVSLQVKFSSADLQTLGTVPFQILILQPR